jgi:hypothetical protein
MPCRWVLLLGLAGCAAISIEDKALITEVPDCAQAAELSYSPILGQISGVS